MFLFDFCRVNKNKIVIIYLENNRVLRGGKTLCDTWQILWKRCAYIVRIFGRNDRLIVYFLQTGMKFSSCYPKTKSEQMPVARGEQKKNKMNYSTGFDYFVECT